MLQLALEQQVKAVWLSFGSDIGKWVRHVREYDAKREHKTLVFVVVSSLSEALTAINDWKVDAVIAQGQSPYVRWCYYQADMRSRPQGPNLAAMERHMHLLFSTLYPLY